MSHTTEQIGIIKEGLKFRSKWFEGIVTVKSFDTVTNSLSVIIDPQEPWQSSWEEDHWNLQDTIWGFETGDYFIEKDQTV